MGFLRNLRNLSRPRGSPRRRAALKKIVVFRVPGTPGTAAFNGRGAEALAVVNRPEISQKSGPGPGRIPGRPDPRHKNSDTETCAFAPPSSTLHMNSQSSHSHHLPDPTFSHLPATGPRPELAKTSSKSILIGAWIPHTEGIYAGFHGESLQPTTEPLKLLLSSFLAQDTAELVPRTGDQPLSIF